MNSILILVAAILLCLASTNSQAEVEVQAGHSVAGVGFAFPGIPAPANNDAGTGAVWTLAGGARDPSSGDVTLLQDGRVPRNADDPAQNFFFRAGTDGGRLQADLGSVRSIKQVGSYSWHAGTRGAQVYKLYGTDAMAGGFQAAPPRGIDPATLGWKLLATVDTRSKEGDGAGQHGVAIADKNAPLGSFRYLLFDIARTEDRDAFGNTFYSEIDIIDAAGPAPTTLLEKPILIPFEAEGGKYRFTVDATGAPDLAEWSRDSLQPVVQKWYPLIVELLPSEGFTPWQEVTLVFRSDMGGTPASASGPGVNMSAPWFRRELKGEALGAVVHELVHVVQSYNGFGGNRRARGSNPPPAPVPGWIVEGIPDYIRWFLYEPQSRGAEITRGNLAKARYDASYRISGNFLDWLTQTYDKDLVRKLNAAAREGRYGDPLWVELTGKTAPQLGEEWFNFHTERLKRENQQR